MSSALRDGEIYIYIIKWWQSTGIVKARGVRHMTDAYPHYECTEKWSSWNKIYRPGEVSESEKGARMMVKKLKRRKAESLKKQLEKLTKEPKLVDSCGAVALTKTRAVFEW